MTTTIRPQASGLGPQVSGLTFDVATVRADFPILSELVHGKPLVYLDSANTSQKPLSVITATDSYYRHANANIHRATHLLSERATALYEGARKKAAAFLNAPDARNLALNNANIRAKSRHARTIDYRAVFDYQIVLHCGLRYYASMCRMYIEQS